MAMSKYKTEQKSGSDVGSDEDPVMYCTPCFLNDQTLPCSGYCLICENYLCVTCFNHHQLSPATKKHILLQKSEMPVGIKKTVISKDMFHEVCEEHDDMMLSYICNKCKRIGCEKCMRDQHNLCSGVAYIPDHIKKGFESRRGWSRNDRRDSFDSTSEITKLEGVRKNIPMYKFAIEKYADDARSQVESFHEAMLEALDNLKTAMDNKIKIISEEDTMLLDLLSKQCDFTTDKFKLLETKIAKYKTNDDKINHLVSCYQMKEENEHFQKNNTIEHLEKFLTVRKIKFQPGFGYEPSGKIALGEIVELKERIAEDTWMALGHINTLFKGKEDIETSNESYIKVFIILMDSRLLVADDQNKSVRLCNTQYKDVDVSNVVVDIVELENPVRGLAQVADDIVAATIPAEKIVQFLEVGQKTLKTGTFLTVKGECYGIGCVDQKLIVGYKDPQLVEIMDLNGHVLVAVDKDNESGYTFRYPRSVTCDSKRRMIYIADFGTNAIVAINLDGKVKIVFQEDGMKGPLAVTIGKEGSVLVAVDMPFSVQRISADFTKCDTLRLKEDTWGINCVAYSFKENVLLFSAGSSSSKIHVRKICF